MIDKFLEYLLLEKKYSSHTIKSYATDLHFFSLFLKKHSSNDCIEKSNPKEVRLFIAYLSENNYIETTINRKISTLKSFFNFLTKINLIEKSPLIGLKFLKIPQKVHTVVSEIEIQTLFQRENIFFDNFIDQRNKTIIEILYSTGIRKSELINLTIQDIDFYNKTIKVLGKRKKERIIPISDQLIRQINQFFSFRQMNFSESDFLLTNSSGKKIAEKTIYNVVKSHLSLVSNKQKLGPHILRHAFGTHLLNNGADISSIKELMGHASLSSTQAYTSVSINNLKKVFNQAHPRGHLKTNSHDN